jgi:RNA polymerase-binding protein DksA
MPRATRSTAKKSTRGAARTAASRKATAKTTKTSRSTKTTTGRRAAATKTTAKRKSTTAAPPPKTAARRRGTTKAVKATKTPARPAKTTSKASAKTPSKTPSKAVAKAPAKRALRPEDKKFLQEQKVLLLEERATYTQQAENLKAEADQLAEEMEPGDIQFDEESGEGGTMNVERERDLALSAQAQAAVEEIDKALAKITDGTYGYCEQCGQPIPKARLKALPYAALCVACKSGGLSRR